MILDNETRSCERGSECWKWVGLVNKISELGWNVRPDTLNTAADERALKTGGVLGLLERKSARHSRNIDTHAHAHAHTTNGRGITVTTTKTHRLRSQKPFNKYIGCNIFTLTIAEKHQRCHTILGGVRAGNDVICCVFIRARCPS